MQLKPSQTAAGPWQNISEDEGQKFHNRALSTRVKAVKLPTFGQHFHLKHASCVYAIPYMIGRLQNIHSTDLFISDIIADGLLSRLQNIYVISTCL
eukprot:scaffold414893_cov14-Prasinocladus_malaysianus.AAC.1